ncbi:DNA mismatch repair protein MutS [Paenibacillus psychroresistens]|uniref:DNA mismatch repair protein MutS n=1 Tax=Paenibacillus psychroresistens TaxID=1778678 RepID=A0A6B8RL90_9BACL|nr:DNA mismatch repair protein MutS [Paenibacillus psychroresistens]QGQ96138.1 DNA mismatch repair protein MutS [Paenibacillus psychroresistens]
MEIETMQRLEYDKIKLRLSDFAASYLGQQHIERMQPLTDIKVIAALLSEVEEGKTLIQHGISVPIPALEGIEHIMSGIGKGMLFTGEELSLVGRLLESTDQLKRFMFKRETVAPIVTSYASSLYELKELKSEIERCIRHGQITDQASVELGKVRKKIIITEERIKKKLESTMQKYKPYLQEFVVSMRGNRYVLSVKKEYRKLINGAVLDESASGQTVFVEPADISMLTYELSEYRAEEAQEEMRVLGALADLLEGYSYELGINLETIGHYDFLFAKAKYALSMDGRSVELNKHGVIRIHGARHPHLGKHTIPLDFAIGEAYSALIITGPNTGGKTAALKTVGLLTLMVQSGLLVPVGKGCSFAVYSRVEVDIGDGQSLEQSLSTFSSHIKNVIRILKCAGPSTLILLDELATGTDPGEGIGLSIAVLEELHRRGATIVATTHFNEIKKFADAAPGFENASMEFDLETLRPLYQLTIGKAGNSYAFYIALQLGIAPEIIERSKAITYSKGGVEGNSLISMETALQSHALTKQPQPMKAAEEQPVTAKVAPAISFSIGDCVWIRSLKRTGIVCELADVRGDMLLLIQKEKVRINHKRLTPYIDRKQLYPEGDYDMDIVFESKEVRKQRKQMGKRHDPKNVIHTSNANEDKGRLR